MKIKVQSELCGVSDQTLVDDPDLSPEDMAEGLTPDPDDFCKVIYVHGKEARAWGKKSIGLAKLIPGLSSPDFEGLSLPERLALLDDFTAGREKLILIGSSLGGLVAALLASRYPERIHKLILLAPAFHWPEAEQILRLPRQSVVLAAEQDEVVPLSAIRAFCQRFQLELKIVQDSHRLEQSMEHIANLVRQVLAEG